MSSNGGLRGNLLLALGACVVTTAAVAAGGELFARNRERHRTTVPGTMPLLFYQQMRLRFALVRNFDYFGWVHVNKYGFRGPDISLEPAEGVFRIITVGASTTFDGEVSRDDRTWPARLQYWLGQLDPKQPVEVVNAGVSGYVLVDELIRLQTELYQFKPNLIILYAGHNELFTALRGGAGPGPSATDRPGEIPVVTPWGHWLGLHSLLYNKIRLKWLALRFLRLGAQASSASDYSDDRVRAAVARGAKEFARDLGAFLAVARNLGIPVVLIDMPNVSGPGVVTEPNPVVRATWRSAMPFATPEMVLEGYARYNEVIREVAERTATTFVTTRSFGLTGPRWYAEGDAIHFNDRGADVAGRRMAEALVASGVLRRAEAPRR